jgi:hypothetical protein
MVGMSRKAVFLYPEVRNRFEGLYCLMEVVSTSEKSVDFYETIPRSIPEGYHLHTRRRENLKSRLIIC